MLTNPMAHEMTGLQSLRAGLAGAALSGPVLSGRCPETEARNVFFDIETAVQSGAPNVHGVIAEILEQAVIEPGFLRGLRFAGSRERYTRHLVYAGPGFTVLALVWLPGQMSPIHAHRSWCALAVRQGTLVETCFTRDAAGDAAKPVLRLDTCRQLHPGMVSHEGGDEEHYHRIANVGVETAVSIHVYGVDYDRLGHGLNRIWEE
jgi:predicted metal-dependent enzyme (double-stranded beta helix superfamily)